MLRRPGALSYATSKNEARESGVMRQSIPDITPSSSARIAAFSAAFGVCTYITAASAFVALQSDVPTARTSHTVYIGNSAKSRLDFLIRRQTASSNTKLSFSSNAARSREFAREIEYGSSS